MEMRARRRGWSSHCLVMGLKFGAVRANAIILGLVCSLIPVSGVTAEPVVAMVVDLVGDILLRTDDGRKSIQMLDSFGSGVEVHVKSNSYTTLVYLQSGRQFQVRGPGLFTVGLESPENASAHVLELSRLDSVRGNSLRAGNGANFVQAAISLRGDGASAHARLISPVETRLRTSTPTFRWRGAPTPAKYRVLIFDTSGEPVWKAEIENQAGIIDAGPPPTELLAAGGGFFWEVHEEREGGQEVIGTARFEVAGAQERKFLTQNAPADGAPFSERLAFALVLSSKGFHLEASEMWAELRRERPELGRTP